VACGLEAGDQVRGGGKGRGEGLQGWVRWADVEGFFGVAVLVVDRVSKCVDVWVGVRVRVCRGCGGTAWNTFWPSGSRDSPCMATQPRLVPPALAEWIAYSALWSCGQLKNSRDLGLLAGVGRCCLVDLQD
jgi:hypothetical protein